MARILAVGVATLDIINEVERYPDEDAELRASAHWVRRGGNATNALVVLSQLGHACDWAGVLSDGADAAIIVDELARYGVGSEYCWCLAGGQLPTSYITLSRATGSRTIVHYRDLPEYDQTRFSAIPLERFDWVHFEGRNVGETLGMMRGLRAEHPRLPVSLEVEKPRDDIECLFPYADLIQVSPAYAEACGRTPAELLGIIREAAPQARTVCTLGAHGAIGSGPDEPGIHVEACTPPTVVDTLGAGDTFLAGLIDMTLTGGSLARAMRFAAALAGVKCAQAGLHRLPVPPRPGD